MDELTTAEGLGLGAKDNIRLVFSGLWQARGSESVIFQIHADDGCRLIIDGNVVIDYEGVHSFSKGITSKPIRLGTGWHKIALDYFEWGGEAGLKVEWAHAGGEFRLLQASQLLP